MAMRSIRSTLGIGIFQMDVRALVEHELAQPRLYALEPRLDGVQLFHDAASWVGVSDGLWDVP